jgi:hypothetical protein
MKLFPEAVKVMPTLRQQSINTLAAAQPSIRAPSPAASGAPSCIMVATSPEAAYEAEEEPEHPRPGSPRKRRIPSIVEELRQVPRPTAAAYRGHCCKTQKARCN